ncbi:MAG: type I DNA topoisomerase [Alphaproteobacteria bacterium]|nr:type I DNA topoisomerase [Alphaproteobacteria bacterium]
MNLLIVESPAKAKTINKYLGKDFTVIASVGHVRDLDPKQGSVHVDDGFKMDWKIDPKKEKNLKEMAKALETAEVIYLSPDPDREGEAIAWHVFDILKQRKKIGTIPVKRVVFHEITKSAIQEALKHPREIDTNLVDAYLGRRALDYLVGYTLSPVLWKKLPGSKSAGRVQSVALRLITEREDEIDRFNPRPYFSLTGKFDDSFEGKLSLYHNQKVEKFFFKTKEETEQAKATLEKLSYTVDSLEEKQTSRRPAPPFTTSTLQQESARKLRRSAKQTMRNAQNLYEAGLITYMRTDSIALSQEALGHTRTHIQSAFGEKYLPKSANTYISKIKNAQEAHEAIRPTQLDLTPEALPKTLPSDEAKLYELIWKRTIASQMTPALFNQVRADLVSNDNTFHAVGTTQIFDGFLTLYQEGEDDKEDAESQKLPPLKKGQKVTLSELLLGEHETKAPPRYTEASLVKKLEEMGIGRPSTYATILSVNQDRGYVRLENRRFVPEDRGRLTVEFLKSYFPQYMEYDFTAKLEDQLDNVAEGKINWKDLLSRFWEKFIAKIESTKDIQFEDVRETLQKNLSDLIFDKNEKTCPKCQGKLNIRLGKFGGFVGCENYPTCNYTRPLFKGSTTSSLESTEEGAVNLASGGELGQNPTTGLNLYLKEGPYGIYIQEGENEKDKKPKRIGLPKGMTKENVSLETALSLISFPKKLSDEIEVGLGRFGPYIKFDGAFYPIPKDKDVLTLSLEEAKNILDSSPKKEKPTEIGLHPKKKQMIYHYSKGRYGPYLKIGRTAISMPKDEQDSTPTLERAIEIVDAKKKAKK